MDNTVITTLVSTSGAVIVGLGGMWISTNQVGKRLDDVMKRLDRLEDRVERLTEMVNGKFAALDLEIAKLMDKKMSIDERLAALAQCLARTALLHQDVEKESRKTSTEIDNLARLIRVIVRKRG